MHFGSPSGSRDLCGKTKLSHVQCIIRQGKSRLEILELTLVTDHLPSALQCWPQAVVCISTPRMYQ